MRTDSHSMTFYDAGSVWVCPDVISLLSEHDFDCLHMQEVERRICFKPVMTHPGKSVDIAFIGLNAYCGEDYRQVVRLANFFVWAQNESGFSTKMKPIMNVYCAALRQSKLAEGTAYYTNYLKVVPPVSHFGPGGGAGVKTVIGAADQLSGVCRQLMCDEIKALVSNGCRIFVCFGTIVAEYFQQAVVHGLRCDMYLIARKLLEFNHSGVKCLVVNGPHFAARGAVEADSSSLATAMCLQYNCIR